MKLRPPYTALHTDDARRGAPKLLFMALMFPAMRLTKDLTGPSLQPAIALSAKLLVEGPTAATAAIVPYALGHVLRAYAHRDHYLPQ